MELIGTTVLPKPERDRAAEEMLARIEAGDDALFSLADKRHGKISGSSRIEGRLSSSFSGCQEYRGKTLISNFFYAVEPMVASDVRLCVHGFGTRFPCDHAWVVATPSPERFLAMFGRDSKPINQNTFLPGACTAFSFGVFGALLLRTEVFSQPEQAGDMKQKKSEWQYCHIRLDQEESSSLSTRLGSISRCLKERHELVARAVSSRSQTVCESSSGGARVGLSDIAKRHFQSMGYSWNKQLSEHRITVFDKVTERGNIVRVVADAGGKHELIPYVDAQFITDCFISPSTQVVNPQAVVAAEQLEALLQMHMSDLNLYEQEIVGEYEKVFTSCDPAYRRLHIREQVRKVVSQHG